MESGPMTLAELKEAASKCGHKRIQRTDGGSPVALESWPGYWAGVPGNPHMSASVEYYLEGNKVRVRKAFESETHWYILSA